MHEDTLSCLDRSEERSRERALQPAVNGARELSPDAGPRPAELDDFKRSVLTRRSPELPRTSCAAQERCLTLVHR